MYVLAAVWFRGHSQTLKTVVSSAFSYVKEIQNIECCIIIVAQLRFFFLLNQYQCVESLEAESNDGGELRGGVWTNSDETTRRNCCRHHGFEVSEYRRRNLN